MAWTWLLAHGHADDRVAHDYVNFLYGDRRYEAAARSWAVYLGNRRNGYMESNWLFNGGFESDSAHVPFDWTVRNLNDDVQAAIDPEAAHSGRRALRLRFGGRENVGYEHTFTTA